MTRQVAQVQAQEIDRTLSPPTEMFQPVAQRTASPEPFDPRRSSAPSTRGHTQDSQTAGSSNTHKQPKSELRQSSDKQSDPDAPPSYEALQNNKPAKPIMQPWAASLLKMQAEAEVTLQNNRDKLTAQQLQQATDQAKARQYYSDLEVKSESKRRHAKYLELLSAVALNQSTSSEEEATNEQKPTIPKVEYQAQDETKPQVSTTGRVNISPAILKTWIADAQASAELFKRPHTPMEAEYMSQRLQLSTKFATSTMEDNQESEERNDSQMSRYESTESMVLDSDEENIEEIERQSTSSWGQPQAKSRDKKQ